jgi:outer membrane protein
MVRLLTLACRLGIGLLSALALTSGPGSRAAAPAGAGATGAPLPDPALGLTLTAAREAALAHNPGWQASLESLRAAEARVAQAEAGGRLQFTARSLAYATSEVPSVDIPPLGSPLTPVPGSGTSLELGPRANTRVELVVEQILLGGPTRPSIERARHALRAARLRTERTRQALLHQVEEAYLRAAVAVETVSVAQESLRARNAHRQVAAVRFETGLAPRYDLVRADTEVAAAEEQVTRVENEYILAAGRLALVLGDPLEKTYHVALPVPEERVLPDLVELVEQALSRRPDLAALEEERRGARAQAGGARAERRPILGLRVEGRASAKPESLEPSGVSVALLGRWALADGGRARALEAEAEAQARALDLERAQLARAVSLEVRAAALSVENARKRVRTAENQVTQAASALEIAQARYELGTGLAAEVAGSEASLAEARLTRLRARLDALLAAAQVRLAMGTIG